MTNRPRDARSAAIVRAMAEMSNGHGAAQGAATPSQVAQVALNAELACWLSDALCSRAIVGNRLDVGPGSPIGGAFATGCPDFATLATKAREEWTTPDALQAVRLSMLDEAARHQAAVYVLVRQAHAIIEKGKATTAAALPEAEAKADATACPDCGALVGHARTCPRGM